jgi:hypothetical protein
MTAAARPTPKFVKPQGANRGRVPQASGPVLRPARSHRRAGADRQPLFALLGDSRDRLPRAAHPPHPHTALPAPHQRQGRAVHPHTARRLGLRRRLPQLNRTRRRPRRLALVLQPPTKTLSPRPQAPDRPPHRANQPSRDLHICTLWKSTPAKSASATVASSRRPGVSATRRRPLLVVVRCDRVVAGPAGARSVTNAQLSGTPS